MLFDLIFTPVCFICREPIEINSKVPLICHKCNPGDSMVKVRICETCKRPLDIDPLSPVCPYCNETKYPFRLFVSPFYNQNDIKLSILDYKFKHAYSNAKTYAYYMAIRLKYLENFNPEAIVPAPSSKLRLFKRGFNHTLIIAKHLSKLTNIPCSDILIKKRHTKPQSTLSSKERQTNLKGAFACKKHNYKSVLLLDDVYTTGSTINELCKTLKKSGVKDIYVITVARSKVKGAD